MRKTFAIMFAGLLFGGASIASAACPPAPASSESLAIQMQSHFNQSPRMEPVDSMGMLARRPGGIVYDDAKGNFVYCDGSEWKALGPGDIGPTGFLDRNSETSLSGGLYMKWGRSNDLGRVDYNSPFPNNTIHVQVTLASKPTVGSGNNIDRLVEPYVPYSGLDRGGFSVGAEISCDGACPNWEIQWMALGK